jgi:hypothetical protein
MRSTIAVIKASIVARSASPPLCTDTNDPTSSEKAKDAHGFCKGGSVEDNALKHFAAQEDN